jgi:FG-GAP-like repeat/FG-GAP repeat
VKPTSLISAGLAVAAFIGGGPSQPKAGVILRPPALRFVGFDAGLPTSGQWREGFRIADMDGDGHLDIVHGPARKQPGPPVIFLGDGKGSWRRWTDARFPPLAYDYGDIEVADFNGDGHLDIALAVHLHGFLVLGGDGHGSFVDASAGLQSISGAVSGFSSRAIRVMDWNGDGLPDLVAVSEGAGGGNARGLAERDGVVIFLNQGPKGWRKSEQTLSKGIYSDSITLGDFDGDGHLDIATASSVIDRKDLVNLWRANGAAAPLALEFPGSHQFVQAVAAGDFDNDGKDDLAVAYLSLENDVWYSALDLFYSRAGGKWERHSLLKEASREGPVALATGHLNSKTTRDLVALTSQGETLVFLSDGHGGLVRNSIPLPVYGGGCRGAHVQLADLNGDGRDEIVAAFADEPATFGAAADRCSSGGGITAWKAVPEQQ